MKVEKHSDENQSIEASLVSIFGFITYDSDYQIVTKKLGIEPTRSRQKGQEMPGRTGVAKARYGIWEHSHKTTGENPTLNEHITYFRTLLSGKLQLIDELRTQYSFETVFYVLVETEDTAGGLELSTS